MSDKTAIEWTDATWNPVTGCTKVSEGCDNCYIARTPPFRIEGRLFVLHCRTCAGHGIINAAQAGCPDCGGSGEVAGATIGATTGVRPHPERLDQPLRWQRPRRIFVNSLSDLFHKDVPDEYIARVFAVMAMASQHTFQVLTKRPGRMRSLLCSVEFRRDVRLAMLDSGVVDEVTALGSEVFPLPNVWLGTSVENQKWADVRIPLLMQTPAAVRFLSCEPLLGPIELTRLHGYCPTHDFEGGFCGTCPDLRLPDWIIVGGESGPGARPMHPGWARSLRDQCSVLCIPFLFKQWGEWAPEGILAHRDEAPAAFLAPDGTCRLLVRGIPAEAPYARGEAMTIRRSGKKAAGRKLDGRTWDEYPTS